MSKVPYRRIDPGSVKGLCCCCNVVDKPGNLIFISRKCAVPGMGWGCLRCDLPQDGAMATICDRCLGLGLTPICAVGAWAGSDVRVGLGTLMGGHRCRPGCSQPVQIWDIGDGVLLPPVRH